MKGLTVCGGDDRIGALNKKVEDGDTLKVVTFMTCEKTTRNRLSPMS